MRIGPVCRSLVVAALIGAAPCAGAAPGPGPLTPHEIDGLVSRAMATFDVPGVAVGIVKDGKLVFARGYGVRRVGAQAPVDPDTLFGIASNSKAFTAAALAILVDEGKLHWDDHVVDYLPEFRMADPYVTAEFTIRDLLTHRSGLGLGAGDLLFVTPTDFTRADVIRTLRYLKPVTGFRSTFAYDNLLYAVAGEVVRAASGRSWEEFVGSRILAPLGMQGCYASVVGVPAGANAADPHVVVEGHAQPIAPLQIPMMNAAGGIQCNVNGMARWVATQLGHGTPPGGKALFSAERGAEMWSVQTPLTPSGRDAELTHSHLGGYGIAWGLEDFDGYLRVGHDGGLPGMVTRVAMLPELGVGVIVLTNQQEGFALGAIATPILEGYAGVPRRDWVAIEREARAERLKAIHAADAAVAPPPATGMAVDPADFAGSYQDAWRGGAEVHRVGDGLELAFSHTTALRGRLESVGRDLFIVRWQDRTLDADAYVKFSRGFDGTVQGFTMRAVSGTTDFSFDFQDLDFPRAGAP